MDFSVSKKEMVKDGKDTVESTKGNKFQIQSIHKQRRQKMKAGLRWWMSDHVQRGISMNRDPVHCSPNKGVNGQE